MHILLSFVFFWTVYFMVNIQYQTWITNQIYYVGFYFGVWMVILVLFAVYYQDEWNVRYIRQCAPSGEIGEDEGRVCKERTGTYRIKMKYCHCGNQHGCNSASNVQLPLVMLLLPVLAAVKSQLSNLLWNCL